MSGPGIVKIIKNYSNACVYALRAITSRQNLGISFNFPFKKCTGREYIFCLPTYKIKYDIKLAAQGQR